MPRNNTGRVVKRVRWRVVRAADGEAGWLPIVFIGDAPVYYAHEPDKATAKATARAACNTIRGAGA